MYGLEILASRALIVGMAAHDLNKVGNYEITHVYLDLLGSWHCDTIHKYTHSLRRTRTNIFGLHRPTLASELAVLIRTDRAPRVTQTHQVGHPIKVLDTTPSPNPQQKSDQTHCHPHMTASHHRIRVGPLTTHPNNPFPHPDKDETSLHE